MEWFLPVLTLLAALAVGAIIPGQSFVFVARTSIARSRREGLAAALGMGVGGTIFSVLILLGLQASLTQVSGLFIGLKIAGALYLIYVAVDLWRGAGKTFQEGRAAAPDPVSGGQAFMRGLLVQLGNPKAVMIYGGVFAALLPRELPRAVALALPVLIFFIEAGWYSVVAVALSSPAPRKAYLKCKAPIDRIAGGVLGLIGVKLLVSAGTK